MLALLGLLSIAVAGLSFIPGPAEPEDDLPPETEDDAPEILPIDEVVPEDDLEEDSEDPTDAPVQPPAPDRDDPIVIGSDDGEVLTGDDGFDELHGEGGDDRIHGAGGDDSLAGHNGDDRVFGGAGHDTLVGGMGDDLLDGGAGDDWLIDLTGRNTLIGGDGEDSLSGGEHGDTLDGRDTTVQVRDWLNGGAGDDRLIGGALDHLNGDAGADSYELSLPHMGAGAATIESWDPTEDVIVVLHDGAPPALSVQVDDEGATLLADGAPIARVPGAGELDLSAIALRAI